MGRDRRDSGRTGRARVLFALAFSLTLAMVAVYTWIDVMQPAEPLLSAVAFLPGVVSVAALLAAGMRREELHLAFAPLSRHGALTLGAITVLLLPILGSNSGFAGWQWLPALVYAPASGIAQELYFRSSLLPALQKALGDRARLALFAHAAIFVAFHLRTFRSIEALPVAALVAAVLLLAGLGWGWQVQRDRTVVWAMLQHGAFLMLMSMFEWGTGG